MDVNWILIRQTLYTMCATLSLIGAVVLLVRSRGNRARRFHAYSMIFCCVAYFARNLGMLLSGEEEKMFGMMNVWVLITGNFLVMLLSLYPLEAVRPGWLDGKKALKFSMPYVGTIAFYFLGTWLAGDGIFHLSGWGDWWEHVGSFNVGCRLLLFLSFCLYFCAILWFIYRSESRYRRWLETCPFDGVSIEKGSWLPFYAYGLLLILLGYLYYVFVGFHPWVLLYHNVMLQLFLFYTFYKVLFYDTPFHEAFSENISEQQTTMSFEPAACSGLSDTGIREKWKSYKEDIAHWFETERPYLREGFQLKDVGERFPLNRSYISRIFNEGYGKSFSLVVRDYRLREAERLLREERALSIAQVAERCGFASSSAFIRVFAGTHGGITPRQYREQLVDNS